MATTVQLKPQALKNIGNVPDWVNKQRVKDKKDAPRPIRRSTPKPKAVIVSQVVPAFTFTKPPVIPQPITEEVKDPIENGVQGPPAGAKVRRIYSREFLIKFKYSATPFPPGAITPQDIIAQYNKDFELRERLAQENSSLIAGKPTVSTPSTTVVPMQLGQATEATTEALRVAPSTERKIKKKTTTEGDKKTFKLRGLEANESILRSPLFRASANKLQATSSGTKRASSPFHNSDDKENPTMVPSKAAKSTPSSTKRHASSPLVTKCEAIKTQKLPTTSPSFIPAPAVVSVPTTALATPTIPTTPTPAPAAIKTEAVPVATPTPTPTPEPATIKTEAAETVPEDKQDVVDVLTKKLKSVLKETDPRRLAQRQKQIEYGKATLGYKDYAKLTAKSKRKREDPKTPNKYQVCSKRSWDGQIRKWRRMLHFYDPADLKDLSQANPDLEGDLDLDLDSKPCMAITAADILAEENALLE